MAFRPPKPKQKPPNSKTLPSSGQGGIVWFCGVDRLGSLLLLNAPSALGRIASRVRIAEAELLRITDSSTDHFAGDHIIDRFRGKYLITNTLRSRTQHRSRDVPIQERLGTINALGS